MRRIAFKGSKRISTSLQLDRNPFGGRGVSHHLTRSETKGRQEMKDTKKDLWDLLEDPKPNQEHTASLISWSMNYDLKTGTPYHIFLDLIGYSANEYGSNLFDYNNVHRVLGYMELDYLADALKEYAENPQAVLDLIGAIDEAERGE